MLPLGVCSYSKACTEQSSSIIQTGQKKTHSLKSITSYFNLLSVRSDTLRPCYFSFYWGNIWSNGNYTQCTYNGNSLLDNIKTRRFKDIWERPETQANMYAAAMMTITGTPAYSTCKGCTGPLLQSAAFHRLFERIPFQPYLIKLRANKYLSLNNNA